MNSATGVTWSSLTSGAAGTGVTLIGALVVAWLTVRHDRRERARERDQTAEVADQAARLRAAVMATAVRRNLHREVSWAPIFRGRTEAAFMEMIVSVSAECSAKHPSVVDWLLREFQQIITSTTEWYGVWWIPRVNLRRIQPAASRVDEMVGALAAWAAGRRDDEWFASRLDMQE